MFRGPGEDAGVMAARRECREAARRVRLASTEEERAKCMEELREKVKAEVELVDRLQEERLDAIEKAAAQRMAALRAQLAEMRAHQAEFIEHEVERMANGRRGEHGPEAGPPEGNGMMDEGRMPPPRDGKKWGGPRRGGFRHPGAMGCRGPGMEPGMGPDGRFGGGCGEEPGGEPPMEEGEAEE
jgi:hypothetical protein